MKRKHVLIVLAVIGACILAGFFLPLGSYTTTRGCPSNTMPTLRLSLIAGENLEDIKQNDKLPTDPLGGCSQNAIYIQYLL